MNEHLHPIFQGILNSFLVAPVAEITCPQCGEATASLTEGYCDTCCAQRQSELDQHNAAVDRWNRMTDAERATAITAAATR